ncbi:hypothetical protein [Lysobacter gummosus]|uniref:hypothetical protein n=1 Tax=Lysobacter gummosus TaxID=262324 RepID=UPI00362638A5
MRLCARRCAEVFCRGFSPDAFLSDESIARLRGRARSDRKTSGLKPLPQKNPQKIPQFVKAPSDRARSPTHP